MFDLDVASLLTPNMILNKVGTVFFFSNEKEEIRRNGFTNQSYHVNKYIWIEYEIFSILFEEYNLIFIAHTRRIQIGKCTIVNLF